MNITELTLSHEDVRKLLASGSGDAALLDLYLQCGNRLEDAAQALNLSAPRIACASATLRQLGLWQDRPEPRILPQEERPNYTEEDVTRELNRSQQFQMLVGEVQRALGRILTTEELKVFLSFQNYLGLPGDVIALLVRCCKDRCRLRGSNRNPSIRMLEKEAYAWAEQGIDTMEAAAAYIQAQNARYSRLSVLTRTLQISGRSLTPAEERYANSWLDMNFDQDALAMAYEKTCLNTGGLKWPYMNKILMSWHQQGLHTGAQILSGDKRPTPASAQAQRVQAGTAALGQYEREAIARMLREQKQEE